MKRIISVLLILMVFLLVPIASFAAEDSGTYKGVNWSLDKMGNLILEGGETIPKGGPWLSYNNDIKSIIIGDGIKTIPFDTFGGLSSLQSVTLGKDVINIEDYAFSYCPKLKSLTLLGEKTIFNGEAFVNCAVSEFALPEESNYIIIDKCVFSKDMKDLVYCFRGKVIVVPEGVIRIKRGAFCSNNSCVSVSLPETVTTIEGGAFLNCSKLTSLIFPSSLVELGDSALMGCASLQSVVFLGEKVRIAGYTSFAYNKKLKSIVLPAVEFVHSNGTPFADCDNLLTAVFSEGTENIPEECFRDCDKLKDVYVPASVNSIAENAFPRASKDFTLWCVSGSYAESWAKENGFKTKENVPVSAVSLSESEAAIQKGKTLKLTSNVEPQNATNKNIEWLSTDSAVATVTKGTVKAVACGECDIICRTMDGSGVRGICHVRVIQQIQAVTLSDKQIKLPIGETKSLSVTIKPADATIQTMAWETSNETVCTVDEKGIITAVGEGKCDIVCKATDGSGKSAKVTVTTFVPDPPILFRNIPWGSDIATSREMGGFSAEYDMYFEYAAPHEIADINDLRKGSYPVTNIPTGVEFMIDNSSLTVGGYKLHYVILLYAYSIEDGKVITDPEKCRFVGGHYLFPVMTEQEVKAAAEDLNTKLTELYGPSDQKSKVKFKYGTAEVKWTDDFGNVLIMDANIYSGISLTYIWSKADETLQEIKKLSEGDKINPAGVKDGL